MSNSADRLIEYSKALMGNEKVCSNQNETIEFVFANMTEEYRASLEESISQQDATYRRLFAYATKFAEFNRNDEFKKQLEGIIKAYENYDFSSEKSITINGNVFSYKEGEFNPEDHMEALEKIGESIKGEKLFAYTNEEGELVVY